MEINLEEKSKELKEFVSQYETKKFLGDISSLMQFIRFQSPMQSLQGLVSPQRQLLYLAALNVTSEIPSNGQLKPRFNDDELEHMKKLLSDIDEGYDQFFYPQPHDTVDEAWNERRRIAMPTFLAYFNQGLLNYEEQIIERVEEYFTPFNAAIVDQFGLNVTDFIAIYNFIDGLPNKFLMENINKKEGDKTWDEFCTEMQEKKIPPWEWQQHLPKREQNFFSWMSDHGMINRFSRQMLIDNFGDERATNFLAIFTCTRDVTNFLYYSEKNNLYAKPIFQIDDDTFQAIEMHVIIQAVYNTLFEFCVSQENLKDHFFAVRGKKLEEKIERIFRRFFKNKSFVYKGYFTQDGHEQDLLFLDEGLSLIIEAKTSKRDEPRRDPDKAYPLIVSNFEETIQKGYDQTYRVKSKFIQKQPLCIFKDQELKQHTIDIRTKNYHHAFSIVVTLDRFGPIQNDLYWMLEKKEDDEYPWSICVDDLEAFLLALEKLGKKKADFVKFLTLRQQMHSTLVATDELEVCGAFLTRKMESTEIEGQRIYLFSPVDTDIFDQIYQQQGLGFDKEKNLELKTSGKYVPLGGF